MIDGLFVDADFQTGECEDVGTMGAFWGSAPGNETKTVSETLPEGTIFLITISIVPTNITTHHFNTQ
ncbi:hypothetical protein [Marvinbryantia formatexigens]|uniref:hypothetical protein n=1 Tax=Marvinbryantia formatexigens TaxID=168384 RepID=UPI000196D0B9|nr:hypothetical protein [Marvinbryantia formatexigens]